MPAWAATLPGAADESVTRTWRTMPICRWPTTEHHPSSDWLTTPTLRRAVVPGARRGVWTPESRTRSCVVVVSRLVTSTTSRSPRGTVIVEGADLMSSAITWTVVVCPVGVTSLEARAPRPLGRPRLAATARAIMASATGTWFEDQNGFFGKGTRGAGAVGAAVAVLRARTDSRTERPTSGRNAVTATQAATAATARVAGGSGSNHVRTAMLRTTTRKGAARSNHSSPARTAAGPPPRTFGTRWLRAARTSWSANPTARAAATRSYCSPTPVQSGAMSTRTAIPATVAMSHRSAAAAETVAKRRGALWRAGARRARPHQTRPP